MFYNEYVNMPSGALPLLFPVNCHGAILMTFFRKKGSFMSEYYMMNEEIP